MHRNPACAILLAVLALCFSGNANATPPPSTPSNKTAAVCSTCPADVLAVDAGGSAASPFTADQYFMGGSTSSTKATIDFSAVINPAPEAVYQSQRLGNFSYVLPGLIQGTTYTIRLHFAEHYWTNKGQRVFNVLSNGTPMLSNFDIIQAANGTGKAVIREFAATPNSSNQIVLQFVTVVNNAAVSGIEVVGAGTTTSVVATPVFSPAAGTYTGTTAVTIADATSGASIHYTTDGSTPGAASPVYSGSIAVGSSETLQAIAVLTGDTNSAVVSAAYVIKTGGGPSTSPTSLTAVASTSTQTYVNWVASSTAGATYSVFRSTTPNFTPGNGNLVGSTGAITNFSDHGLTPSTAYFYAVEANPAGSSPAAGPVAITTLGAATTGAPGTPTSLSATAASANEIDLTWNSSTVQGVNYQIFRSTTAGFTASASNQIGTTRANMYQDVTLTAGTAYFYQIKASDPIATSAATAAVTAATAALGTAVPFWDASNIPPTQNVLTYKFLNRTNGRYTDAQVFWSITVNKVTTTKSIADQPTFDMPANSSGRMYFYLGKVGQSSTDYFDFVEFTVGPTSINTNTTRVDAFGIKLAMHLTCGDGTDITVGENAETFAEDRATTFQRYLAAVPAPFQPEAQKDAPYRIIEPGAGGFNAGGAFADYYTTYINDVYSSNGLTIVKAGPNGSGLGAFPNLSAAIFRHVAAPGTFNPNGTLVSQATWGNPANFYQTDPSDHYAQFLHANAINGQQYAFPYDDAGGYSSDVSCSKPKTMIVAIGW